MNNRTYTYRTEVNELSLRMLEDGLALMNTSYPTKVCKIGEELSRDGWTQIVAMGDDAAIAEGSKLLADYYLGEGRWTWMDADHLVAVSAGEALNFETEWPTLDALSAVVGE